jgi:hypothetical protein
MLFWRLAKANKVASAAHNSLKHAQGAVLLYGLGQLDGRAVCESRVGQTEALQVCVAAQRLEQLRELLIGNVLKISTPISITIIVNFVLIKDV